jgi:hypothetical protein
MYQELFKTSERPLHNSRSGVMSWEKIEKAGSCAKLSIGCASYTTSSPVMPHSYLKWYTLKLNSPRGPAT